MDERERKRAKREAEREALIAALRRDLGLEVSREELIAALFAGYPEVGEPDLEEPVRVEQAGKPRRKRDANARR